MRKPAQPQSNWTANLGHGVKVVIIDSGFNPLTRDVNPCQVRSFVGGDPSTDVSGHGSRVASIIGGRSPGCPGVAPECQLYIAKIIHAKAYEWRNLTDALEWALELGADVVNMSFACPQGHPKAQDLIGALDRKGAICIGSYNDHLPWPHQAPSVVAVGCLEEASADCDIRGPGRWPAFSDFCGSSVAAAITSGVAACIKAYDPAMNRVTFVSRFAAS